MKNEPERQILIIRVPSVLIRIETCEKVMIPKDVDLIIDRVARHIVNTGIDSVAMIFLEAARPLSTFGGQMAYLSFFPALMIGDLFSPRWRDFGVLLSEYPEESIDKLIMLIKKLKKEKESTKKS